MKAIITKYVGATEDRGSRIVATMGNGFRASVAYDHALDDRGNHDSACQALLLKSKLGGNWYGGELDKSRRVYTLAADGNGVNGYTRGASGTTF